MSFWSDTKHLFKSMSNSFKSRPSAIAKRYGKSNMLNAAFKRGVAVGSNKAKMYGPAASTGILNSDWPTSITSFPTLIRSDFKNVCARAEGLYRMYPVARRAISLFANAVIGSGVRPYPAIRYANGEQPKLINERLSNDWERFVDQGIRNGTVKTNFYQGQIIEFSTMAVYGSTLSNVVNSKKGSLLPYSFQFLKPTRLDFSKDTMFENNGIYNASGKKIIHGIEIDEYADAKGFYLENDGYYSSDRMLLSFFPIETEQYLGLSWLYPVMCAMHDHDSLFADKMKQSRIGARLGVKLAKEDGAALQEVMEQTSDGESYIDLPFQGFFMGKDKPEPIAITDPISDTFKPLVDMIMGYIAMGMGFSYQAFTTDLKGANFSGARTNTIGDNRTFNCAFKKFIDYCGNAKWEKFVEWEVLTGRLAEFGVTPQAYYRDQWYYNRALWLPMDYQEWVDPLNDQQALVLSYKTGQITFRQLCARSGKNLSTQLKELKEEREELIVSGLSHLLPENINMSTKATPSQQTEPVMENNNEE